MNNTIVCEYNNVFNTTLTVYGNGKCDKSYNWRYHRREVINKMACFFTGWRGNLVSDLHSETRWNNITTGSKIFVAPECKTGRDTFRNAGYQITRDRANANAIIVPDVLPDKCYSMTCNIVAIDEENNDLYLLEVCKDGYYSSDQNLSDFEIDIAKKFLKTTMLLTPYDVEETNLRVWFLQKCKDWKDIMTNTKLSIPYIQESQCELTTSTTINPETLLFWENISDPKLLMGAICSSDWSKYPVTVLCLLTGFRGDNQNWFYHANGDGKRILNSIGYQAWFGRNDDFLKDRRISPEDYEMLQSFVFYRLGINENGGMINMKQWNSLPNVVKKLMQRRVVVKPFKLSSKMSCSNLMSMQDV